MVGLPLSAKWEYQWLRGAVIVAGALILALVALCEQEYSWIFAVLSILASLVVAICAGMESLLGFVEIWREQRVAAEIIKSEGLSFAQLAGVHASFKTH